MPRFVVLLPSFLLCACQPGNDLPSAGKCDAARAQIVAPTPEPVALAGEAAPFDDLWFSVALDRVIAIPEGHGVVYLVDPATLAVTSFSGFGAIATGDATATRLYLGDRGNDRVLVVDAASGSVLGQVELGANPDYVRLAPDGRELWVTQPGHDRIAVYELDDAGMAGPASYIDIDGGPEGLTFAPSGARAYTQQFTGTLVVIDVATREVIDEWETGCAHAHGYPQIDEMRGLVISGCSSDGAAVVLDADEGQRKAGFSAGGDAAILAYNPTLEHFYLRGDPGGDLAILGLCDAGTLDELTRVDVADEGHGMVADPHGNVWVCDATHGGLLRVHDPAAD